MTITITAYKGRSSEHLVTVTDADGETSAFAATDLMRLKIGNSGFAPLLDLHNIVPATTTSFLSPRDNPSTLTLHQDDLTALTPGVYDLEVAIVDDSDDDKIKHASKGVFVLLDTQAGNVGLT